LRPYLPAAGSALKSSGAAGDCRKIRELLLSELADVLMLAVEEKMAEDGVEATRRGWQVDNQGARRSTRGALFGV
jgi:hypothetical protein